MKLTLFVCLLATLLGLVGVLTRVPIVQPFSCAFFSHQCMSLDEARETVSGYVAPGFEDIKDQVASLIKEGHSYGFSFSAYKNGEKVVDVAGGRMGPPDQEGNKTEKYTTDTMQLIYSSGKVAEAIAIAILVDRGLLDYDLPIATWWPEFAQGNKGSVTLAQFMRHEGGVPYANSKSPDFVPTYSLFQLKSKDSIAKLFEEQEHVFGGKNTRAYHALTRGLVLSELIHRVDPKHRYIGQFIEEEIVAPLGVEYHVGLPEEKDSRASPMHKQRALLTLIQAFLSCTGIVPHMPDAEQLRGFLLVIFTGGKLGSPLMKNLLRIIPGNLELDDCKREFREIELSSANSHSNAKSMAKIAALMSNKGALGDVRLISEETWEKANHLGIHATALDVALSQSLTMTDGGWGVFGQDRWTSALPEHVDPDCRIPPMTGWGGKGGSLFMWNGEEKVGFGFAMNTEQAGFLQPRTYRLMCSLFKALDKKTE